MTADQDQRFQKFRQALEASVLDAIEKYQIACEELTKKQIASVMIQALACGDIVKICRVNDQTQDVIYIPFSESARLHAEIRRLEAILDQHGISYSEIEP